MRGRPSSYIRRAHSAGESAGPEKNIRQLNASGTEFSLHGWEYNNTVGLGYSLCLCPGVSSNGIGIQVTLLRGSFPTVDGHDFLLPDPVLRIRTFLA